MKVPTIQVRDPSGAVVVINESDLPAYRVEGYTLVGEELEVLPEQDEDE